MFLGISPKIILLHFSFDFLGRFPEVMQKLGGLVQSSWITVVLLPATAFPRSSCRKYLACVAAVVTKWW
jgi:hypothetical protein